MYPTDNITNAVRAERCQGIFELYNDDYGVEANLVDFLADARHWCDAHNHSFGELDRIAYGHYLEERHAEQRRQP